MAERIRLDGMPPYLRECGEVYTTPWHARMAGAPAEDTKWLQAAYVAWHRQTARRRYRDKVLEIIRATDPRPTKPAVLNWDWDYDSDMWYAECPIHGSRYSEYMAPSPAQALCPACALAWTEELADWYARRELREAVYGL